MVFTVFVLCSIVYCLNLLSRARLRSLTPLKQGLCLCRCYEKQVVHFEMWFQGTGVKHRSRESQLNSIWLSCFQLRATEARPAGNSEKSCHLMILRTVHLKNREGQYSCTSSFPCWTRTVPGDMNSLILPALFMS